MVGLVSYILQKLMNEVEARNTGCGQCSGRATNLPFATAHGRGLASHQDFTLGNGCGIF